MKFTEEDLEEERCTREEFLAQFDLAPLEAGSTYVQHKGQWAETHFKILFVSGKVCLGISTWSKLARVGEYGLFLVDSGLKYNENLGRSLYFRLRSIKHEEN